MTDLDLNLDMRSDGEVCVCVCVCSERKSERKAVVSCISGEQQVARDTARESQSHAQAPADSLAWRILIRAKSLRLQPRLHGPTTAPHRAILGWYTNAREEEALSHAGEWLAMTWWLSRRGEGSHAETLTGDRGA